MARLPLDPTIPLGKCQCGCGEQTSLITATNRGIGHVKGSYCRYVLGHQRRTAPEAYIIEDRGYRTPCHTWQRSKANGYGKMARGGKERRAHVWYYEDKYGPIPAGMDLDHLCRHRDCVNPDHLEPVTRAVNLQRGGAARLTPDRVGEIRSHPEIPTSVFARRFGVSSQTIRVARRGQTWANVPA